MKKLICAAVLALSVLALPQVSSAVSCTYLVRLVQVGELPDGTPMTIPVVDQYCAVMDTGAKEPLDPAAP